MPWKNWAVFFHAMEKVFHAMETFPSDFPRHGKLPVRVAAGRERRCRNGSAFYSLSNRHVPECGGNNSPARQRCLALPMPQGSGLEVGRTLRVSHDPIFIPPRGPGAPLPEWKRVLQLIQQACAGMRREQQPGSAEMPRPTHAARFGP